MPTTSITPPPINAKQFSCGDQPKLPSDNELKTWDASTIFEWGKANALWGSLCFDRLVYNEHYIHCLQGNKMECAFVNQQQYTLK